MKRKIAILLVLLMTVSALAFTACGGGGSSSDDLSESKYVGTWKADAVTVGDESENVADEYLLIVNGDGTGELTGEGETSSFTWEPIDGGFKTAGDVKAKFKEDGDNIVVNMLGIKLIFVKQ